MEIEGEHKKYLERGVAFGELALIYNAPRSAGLKAKGDCYVWGLQRRVFKKVLMEMNSKDR